MEVDATGDDAGGRGETERRAGVDADCDGTKEGTPRDGPGGSARERAGAASDGRGRPQKGGRPSSLVGDDNGDS